MIQSNVVMLAISIIVILCLIAFGIAITINIDYRYLIPVIALVGYLFFSVISFLNEYKIYKADKVDGVRGGILQFGELTVFKNINNHKFIGPCMTTG